MADVYEIWLREHLDTRWSDRFEGFVFSYREDSTTLLVGSVPHQAALHGLLARVRDLGLRLLAVTCIGSEQRECEPHQADGGRD